MACAWAIHCASHITYWHSILNTFHGFENNLQLVDATPSMSIPSEAYADQINLYLLCKWHTVQYSKGGKNFPKQKCYTLQSDCTNNYASCVKVIMCHTPMTHCLRCTGKWFAKTLLFMSRYDVRYRTRFYHLLKMFTLIFLLLDHQLGFQFVFLGGDIGSGGWEPSLIYINRLTIWRGLVTHRWVTERILVTHALFLQHNTVTWRLNVGTVQSEKRRVDVHC